MDGFTEAYSGRPELLLDSGVQGAMSSWTMIDRVLARRFEEHLSRDLTSGEWDRQYGHLRCQLEYPGSLRLVVRSFNDAGRG